MVEIFTPQKLAYALNQGFFPLENQGFIKESVGHVVSLGRGRRRRKGGARWKGGGQAKEPTLFDLLERTTFNLTIIHPSLSPNQEQPHSLCMSVTSSLENNHESCSQT